MLLRNLLLFSLLLSAELSFAANKFIIIQENAPIPKNKFIYALQNIKTGQLYLGYSKTELEFDEAGRIVGGVRNGGHAELLQHALGIPNASVNEFKMRLPDYGQGEHVGGGFIISEDGYVFLHRSMSNKAAGALGSEIKGTVNTRLPQVNRSWGALIPEAYAFAFYDRISQRTQSPLVIDYDITGSETFVFNQAKHAKTAGQRQRYVESVTNGTKWMPAVVAAVNAKNHPDFIPPRQTFSRVRRACQSFLAFFFNIGG